MKTSPVLPEVQWAQAMASERMHHAWLLSGRAGMGKARFAMKAARALVGADTDLRDHADIHRITMGPKDDANARKSADGKPYDIARSIRVDQVRALQRRLTTRPTLGSRRAVIIEPVDNLETAAANALLKSLEEPPVGTFFLLVSHRPGALLPTIRSRCRALHFAPLSNEALFGELRAQHPQLDTEAINAAVIAARGSPGAAERFLSSGMDRLFGVLQQLIECGESEATLTDVLGARPKPESFQHTFSLARSLLTTAIRTAGRDGQHAAIVVHAEIVQLQAQAPTMNFDAGLLLGELRALLARVGTASARLNA